MFSQHLLLLGNFPVCKTVKVGFRQHNNLDLEFPSYEPYIPRTNAVFFKCTTTECFPYSLDSITQLPQQSSNLRHCFLETPDKYACETLKYSSYKNIDKILFLKKNIQKKTFYLADCLVYSDGLHICHKKDDFNSHAKLIDIGTLAKPNEDAILSQDELICEETTAKKVNCELNLSAYSGGGTLIASLQITGKILLKTGSYLVSLKLTCKNTWCGYNGQLLPSKSAKTRRQSYEPPGGSVYRCYYAKKQQVCKKLYGSYRQLYNERDWVSA